MEIREGSGGFFKLNPGHSRIYTVAYANEQFGKVGDVASPKPDVLTVEDLAGLVADMGTACPSGYAETTRLLNLVFRVQG